MATYKTIGTKEGDPWTRQYFEQIDYILIPKRWQNGITNAETHSQANIDSDHFPVTVECTFKLKKIVTKDKRSNRKKKGKTSTKI